MTTVTNSESFILEQVLNRPFSEKINAESVFVKKISGGPKKQKQLNGNSHSTAFVFLDDALLAFILTHDTHENCKIAQDQQ